MRSRDPRDVRIAFLGDSYTVGVGDPELLGWVGRLCRACARADLAITGYGLGVRRQTTVEVAARADEVASRLAGDFEKRIVVSTGVNDTALLAGERRSSEAASVAALESLLARLRDLAPILVVGPPWVPDEAHAERVNGLSARFAEVAAALGCRFVETFSATAASAVWRREVAASDGFHPAAAGYARLAEAIGASEAWSAFRRRSRRFEA